MTYIPLPQQYSMRRHTLAYKHVLNPPAKTVAEMAQALINQLSKEEQAALQQMMGS